MDEHIERELQKQTNLGKCCTELIGTDSFTSFRAHEFAFEEIILINVDLLELNITLI